MTVRDDRPIIHAEELEAASARLLDELKAIAEGLREKYQTREPEFRPDGMDERLEAGIRTAIEGEFVPVRETVEGRIEPGELSREIIKKALVGLGGETLRNVASDRGLPTSGPLEQVAIRVGKSFAWNEAEVAAFVVTQEQATSTDRGFSTRLFPTTAMNDPEQAARRLDFVAHRYIKIGLARWFIFRNVSTSDEIKVEGAYRSYQANIDRSSVPRVGSVETEREATAVLAPDVLQVHGASVSTARACVDALHEIGAANLLRRVPRADFTATQLDPGELHQTSEFLLDILYTRLAQATFTEPNFTLAKFKVGDLGGEDVEEPESGPTQRPALRGVRLEGSHLLDSRDACRMMYVDKRPLVDLTMTVKVKSEQGVIKTRVPVRIALEKDHVLIATGFGTGDETLAETVHGEIVDAVSDEIRDGISDEDRLQGLVDQIAQRANVDTDPDEATFFSPSDAEIQR